MSIFLRIDDSQCNRIHSPLTPDKYFDSTYVEKQTSGFDGWLYWGLTLL